MKNQSWILKVATFKQRRKVEIKWISGQWFHRNNIGTRTEAFLVNLIKIEGFKRQKSHFSDEFIGLSHMEIWKMNDSRYSATEVIK